jgi:transposase
MKEQVIARVAGIDLGDDKSHICVLDPVTGEIVLELTVPTAGSAITDVFAKMPRMRVMLETGTHSNWVARALKAQGHDVVVAHARKLRMVSENLRKSDRTDAHILAMLAASQVQLVKAVTVRSARTQAHMAVVRARDLVVRTRTTLAVSAKGFVKAAGARLPAVAPESLPRRAWDEVPEDLRPAIRPLLVAIAQLTRTVRRYDREIARMCREEHPETALLTQVHGIGAVTALAFALTIESASRFRRSRDVGPFLGLVPAMDQSGRSNPKLGISKAGDPLLRRLLTQCAHQAVRAAAPDSAVKRWACAYVARKGKGSKKPAATAVARKLAVLLHALWASGAPYEPLRGCDPASGAEPPKCAKRRKGAKRAKEGATAA